MPVDLRARLVEGLEQERPRLRPGSVLMRGLRPLYVLGEGDDGALVVQTPDGEEEMTRAEIFERAVDEVVLPPPASFLDRAWQVARAAGLPAADRLLYLRGVLNRAPSREEGEEIVRWMAAISAGLEPRREAVEQAETAEQADRPTACSEPTEVLVRDREWQRLRESFVGTWKESGPANLRKLRAYAFRRGERSARIRRLRRVLNYLTGTGFRTRTIRTPGVGDLRDEVKAALARLCGG